MARNSGVLHDWSVFGRWGAGGGRVDLCSRFPAELAFDLIVCPHLYDRPATAPRGFDVYTYAGTPRVAVFCGRGASHLGFLIAEVAPRVHRHVLLTVVVDAEAQRFIAMNDPARWRPVDELPGLLNYAYGCHVLADDAFTELGSPCWPPLSFRVLPTPKDNTTGQPQGGFQPSWGTSPTTEEIERATRHPIRLWEALFWRGHTYRYELVNGEVPLIGHLYSADAASTTHDQLIADAERLVGEATHEDAGWLVCGPVRVRRLDAMVELRLRLSPADVRAAFIPQARQEGDDAFPSPLGVLMAGGRNGKTELEGGWTWSTTACASPEQARATALALRDPIATWTQREVYVTDTEHFHLPEKHRDVWFIHPHDRYLTTFVPFAREDCLPWRIHAGE